MAGKVPDRCMMGALKDGFEQVAEDIATGAGSRLSEESQTFWRSLTPLQQQQAGRPVAFRVDQLHACLISGSAPIYGSPGTATEALTVRNPNGTKKVITDR